jgi:ATP-dependent DNA helicase RecG
VIRELGIVDIDADAVARILLLEEGHFQDLKAKEIAAAKVAVHATAFANSAGGEIYIGVDEVSGTERSWRGFNSVEEANGIAQTLHEVFQGNDLISLQFLRGAGVAGFVMHLVIEKSREIVTATDGDIYVRLSAQKLPVRLSSHEEVERLKLDKGLASYEDMPIDSVPLDLITDSLTATEFMIESVPVSEAEPWLRSQRLIIGDNPTVAGVLLYCDEPQAILPKRSAIKILRYRSSESEGARDQMDGDPITIEGPLTNQISEAVGAVIDIVQSQRVQTPRGLEEIHYPPETLHEIVTNAVLHRDYSIATDIQVRVFDNRIEVDSPGKLAGHVNEENILDEQFARNGKIVRLINKFPNPPNKDVGEGLNTAYAKMRDLGLKHPQISEEGNHVVAYIRHERLASYEEQILEYLKEHQEINNSTARQLTGEGSENKMKRVFEKMIDAGQIYRDPDRKGSATAYLLGPKPPAD